jgi:hypothetical protein
VLRRLSGHPVAWSPHALLPASLLRIHVLQQVVLCRNVTWCAAAAIGGGVPLPERTAARRAHARLEAAVVRLRHGMAAAASHCRVGATVYRSTPSPLSLPAEYATKALPLSQSESGPVQSAVRPCMLRTLQSRSIAIGLLAPIRLSRTAVHIPTAECLQAL